ncbi:MAG: carboxypeptidase-like regulatory domain-containing protein [Verrucomicrobiota bacterium JB024]|nr:carboxypeptidase-like regulatory domain-containing protein [Verrucomicrobiota bacterium JB024]
MNNVVVILLALLLCLCTSCSGKDSLEVSVKVIDQNGTPVPDATVSVGFLPLGIGGSFAEGKTDKGGVFVANGESNLHYRVSVEKDGYYDSSKEQLNAKMEVEPGKWKVVDQDVVLVLRKIKNPIAMYARSNTTINLYTMDEEVGFDLLVFDWVAPYGKGKVADITFELSGYYHSFRDKDSTLTVRFPNKGDGACAFDAITESQFISPYEAPANGYSPTLSYRKMTKPTDKLHEWDNENTVDETRNYAIRFRTVLDEDGNVVEAMYAKIYGDFDFAGASDEGSYIRPKAYYVNPTVNDRNLEYAVGSNLVDNNEWDKNPKRP